MITVCDKRLEIFQHLQGYATVMNLLGVPLKASVEEKDSERLHRHREYKVCQGTEEEFLQYIPDTSLMVILSIWRCNEYGNPSERYFNVSSLNDGSHRISFYIRIEDDKELVKELEKEFELKLVEPGKKHYRLKLENVTLDYALEVCKKYLQ